MPPEILCEDVPPTPVEPVVLHDIGYRESHQLGHRDGPHHGHHLLMSNSSHHMSEPAPPSGSLLAVNRPLELRESALSVNFPFMEGGK